MIQIEKKILSNEIKLVRRKRNSKRRNKINEISQFEVKK